MINLDNLKYLYNVKILYLNYAVVDSLIEEEDRDLYNQMMNMMKCNKKEIDKIDNPELKSIALQTFNRYLSSITKATNKKAEINLDW